MALSPDSGMKFRNKLDSIDEGERNEKDKNKVKEPTEDAILDDNPNRLVYKKVITNYY